VSRLGAGEQKSIREQQRWYVRKLHGRLESAGLKVVDLESQPFDLELAATGDQRG